MTTFSPPASAEKIKTNIATGQDELNHATVANRLLSGENAVKVWREHCGLAAKDLATKAAISAPYGGAPLFEKLYFRIL